MASQTQAEKSMLLAYTYFSQIVNSFTKISNSGIKTNGILMCRAAKKKKKKKLPDEMEQGDSLSCLSPHTVNKCPSQNIITVIFGILCFL